MTVAHGILLGILGLLAGGIGALGGLGGGIVITPMLAIYFGVPMHQAIGTSLMAVIATSTATSSVYVERGISDMRLGMTLEMATTIGAAIAAVIAGYIDRTTLAILFTLFMIYTAASLARKAWHSRNQTPEADHSKYRVVRLPIGLGGSLIAGGMSGLLGIGGGPIKVPIMYLFMGVPLRVATATSNFMIGVTAAASAYIYYGRGDIPLYIAAPVVIGVFVGSLAGAKLGERLNSRYVLYLLIAVTAYLAGNMAWQIRMGKF